MTYPNVPLLMKTLEHIVAHPEEWKQGVWGVQEPVCGTAFCYAGTAVHLNGNKLNWQSNIYNQSVLSSVVVDGKNLHPRDAAQNILGLTHEQSDKLFNSGNDIDDIKDILYHITNGEIGVCFAKSEGVYTEWCWDN